ncbi:hypothetical protein [Aliiroseovarius subalbicans]|uniref:hypothetical protein n=1 Tax=Aliiroseovarius subalbicans TaxID=2925840 RepID=UPI001F56B001|nr:hypothetical protein [Aliiroseovarius subalbicans]MCI2398986.1 hypothetical protein [Aliiroseovarius subalbicans]
MDLHGFRAVSGVGVEVPATQSDLWLWLRGNDRGEIATRARGLLRLLAPGFEIVRNVDGFKLGVDLDTRHEVQNSSFQASGDFVSLYFWRRYSRSAAPEIW